MKSIDIAKDLSSSTVRCIKKKIKYNLVRYNIVDDNMYSKIIQTPFTIIPYLCVPAKYKKKTFKTKLAGDKFIEQSFVLKENECIVVGSVGEIYNVKLEKQFISVTKSVYVPIREVRSCIQIDKTIYDKYVVKERIPTSWGAKHFCKVGDYLIVQSDGVYRVQKNVFDKTYKILK